MMGGGLGAGVRAPHPFSLVQSTYYVLYTIQYVLCTLMTGLGKSILSRMTGFSMEQSVSPVMVSFSPTTATMSPAERRGGGVIGIVVEEREGEILDKVERREEE
jgi:hypothetical protein